MFNLFIPSKKTLIVIGALIVLIIVFTLISSLSNPDVTPPAPLKSPRPLTRPISSITTNNLPDSSSLPVSSPETAYSPETLEKDYQRIVDKKPLTESDAEIRTRLISSLNNQRGYLKKDPAFNIEYVKAPNVFMVEILSENADQAKKTSLKWFYDQGMSVQGVCNLPVSLYLSSTVKNSFNNKGLTFDPIPEGCSQ